MRRVLSPGVFTEIAGVRAESNLDLVEYGPGMLSEKLRAELGIVFAGDQTVLAPRTILERLVLHGAEPIAAFRGRHMTGMPAVTRNSYGHGWVIYAGTDSAQNEFHESLAHAAASVAKLSPLIHAPYGVEVVSRQDAGTIYYFLLNLTETAHSAISLPNPMEDLLSGEKAITQVPLRPLDVAVLASRAVNAS